MGIFGKLLKAGVDTVMVPVEIIRDAATLGGVCVGRDESYTAERLRKIGKSLEEAYDKLDED